MTDATITATATPANRLSRESSPYLLLHAHNPVDWYPWGEEALARARAEDKPIFLSVGYSTCYWCHVMERESFSSPDVAARMNRDFVNVKLDREERPDLDEIYMAATQILSGQGGWPNSVFLTPDLKPFYAGTYFPPEDRYGRPGFTSVLAGLAESWRTRRGDVEEQAGELAEAMRRYLEQRDRAAAAPPPPDVARRALDSLARRYDAAWGGFGEAPKFPTPSNLFLLLHWADRDPQAAAMLAGTLDQMARGGLYDQLAGGFHRYATDREWKVPHFEKMLYDNGLLLEVYARSHARSGDLETARIARETAAFLGRELSAPEGAFWSAIDAETDGHEGAYYVWARAELDAALGPEDAAFLAPLYGFDGPPFFEGDRYVLHLPAPVDELARRRQLGPAELLAEIAPLRQRLLAARERRPRPATDDKVLTDWNGTAVAGLATAGEALGDPQLVARAARAADFLLQELRPAGGPLLHAWRGGAAKIPAMLADYALLGHGLLALHRASGERRWLDAAAELTHEQIERLGDPGNGGFFTAGASADVLFRSKDIFDGAMPGANAVAALNLVELAERTRERKWLDPARRTLQAFGGLVASFPEGARTMAIAAERYAAVAGEDSRPAGDAAAAGARSAVGELEELGRQLVTTRLEVGEPGEDDWRPFRLTLGIAPGWHLNANPPANPSLIPTSLAAKGARFREVAYPPGDRPLYEGEIAITGALVAEEPGARLLLTYQPCDESRCLPPVRAELSLPSTA
ncbi:MAG TPA: thioredoxin domain-containing protein [Thermoanaerobaculia bacterium]|nr:thioredoxin domain-containing protein [Thermoanaerobaculia bacterium]